MLEKLRVGTELTDDHAVLDRGLVSYSNQLEALLAEALGWAAEVPTPELLAHLAALNAARAVQERPDDVKYLRPAY